MAAPSIRLIDLAPPADTFLTDVQHGLRAVPKQLPCKYFYDEAGAQLYERICDLPEYYLNRLGLAIMERHAGEMAELLGPRCLLIEYGSGNGATTRLLLDQLREPAGYVPIDMSREQLLEAATALSVRYPGLAVWPVCADFTPADDLPELASRRVDPGGTPRRRCVYFAGSTIGNFTPEETVQLLRRTARRCGSGGGLLLGADLKKDPAVLHAAYNDSQGVTAAFNLNLLARINRELGADFQVERFWHHAVYHPALGRIEMYLVSQCAQRVRLAGEEFAFDEGEAILTEVSYKYNLEHLRTTAATAGFDWQCVWTDDRKHFSVIYLTAR
jgi:dimethylhistidine N-methyltransferase